MAESAGTPKWRSKFKFALMLVQGEKFKITKYRWVARHNGAYIPNLPTLPEEWDNSIPKPTELTVARRIAFFDSYVWAKTVLKLLTVDNVIHQVITLTKNFDQLLAEQATTNEKSSDLKKKANLEEAVPLLRLPESLVSNSRELENLEAALFYEGNRKMLKSRVHLYCAGQKRLGIKLAYDAIFMNHMIVALCHDTYGKMECHRVYTIVKEVYQEIKDVDDQKFKSAMTLFKSNQRRYKIE